MHGLEDHAEELDDCTADEQQSPTRHRQSPADFLHDPHRDNEEEGNEDRHGEAIAWSNELRVNRS